MRKTYVIIGALAALALGGCDNFSLKCGGTCSKGSPYPLAPYATGDGWRAVYGSKFPDPLPKDANGNVYFDFGEPHYVIHAPVGVAVGKTITMRFAVEGTGTLQPTDPADTSKTALLRLFLQRKDDRLTNENYRWWGTTTANITSTRGDFTLVVKIDPANWTQVYGKSGTDQLAGFNDAIANVGNMGFTFGGMFAGHGDAAVGGPVRFILKEYSVQ